MFRGDDCSEVRSEARLADTSRTIVRFAAAVVVCVAVISSVAFLVFRNVAGELRALLLAGRCCAKPLLTVVATRQ